MEHFGFLIVPAAIILFCLAFEKCKKEECPLSLEIIGEIKVVEPVYVSQKLLARLTKGVTTLLCCIFCGLIKRNSSRLCVISIVREKTLTVLNFF
jgi:hypothetical protein